MHGFIFQVLSHTSTLATNTFTISWRSLVWCMRKSLSLWRNWRVGYTPTSYPFRTHPQAASSKGPQWPWQTSLSMAQQRREKRPPTFFFGWPCQMQQTWSPQTLWSIVSSMLNGPQCYKWDTSYSEALNLLKILPLKNYFQCEWSNPELNLKPVNILMWKSECI